MLPPARALINGAPVDPTAPAISLFDRGFLYAEGVFEVLRTYGGVPRALEDHLARLTNAAGALAIPMGVPTARWISEVRSLLSDCPWGESVIRLTLTRGIAPPGLSQPAIASPTRVVMVYPLPATPALASRAVRVITLRGVGRATPSSGRKTLEYLTSLWALREAARAGADDAILLDGRGEVVEATSANVFVASGDEVITTPPDVGLPGVTQLLLLEAARAEALEVIRRPISSADLWTADEVFLSSSVRELSPVCRVDDHEVPACPGPVTEALQRRYSALIASR